jgi:hypothetical protein
MKLLDILEPHETWEVVDSSKLTTYMRCARKYFFQYVLGWQTDYPNNHLVFGSAWHLAVEHLLLNKYTPQAIEEAQSIFLSRYREDFDASSDDEFSPKTPLNALESLAQYAERFKSDIRQYQVLHTEIAGLVMISPNASMHFKLDALVSEQEGKTEKERKYLFIDHKTSQRKMSNWGDHWQLSTQMLLYFHVVNCLYPRENVGESRVRCTFFYTPLELLKKKGSFRPTEFEECSIGRNLPLMEAWLERTTNWYNRLKTDMQILSEDKLESITMKSFPQNDTACFDFGRPCQFFDFCNAYSNPLVLVDRGIPIGFRKEFWDPRASETIRERLGTIGG